MDEVEQLQAIRALAMAQLATLHDSPQPSYTVDGQVVGWREYVSRLEKTVDWCEEKLAAARPFEIRSQATT